MRWKSEELGLSRGRGDVDASLSADPKKIEP